MTLRDTALVALLVVLVLPARGAVRVWNGSYSPYWSAPLNWDGGIPPTNGDDLVFPSGAGNLLNTNNTVTRLNSITIGGSGYMLRSFYSITLTNGISGQYVAGDSAVDLPVSLASSQTFSCLNAAATLTISGDIALGSGTLTVQSVGNLILSGAISGAGGVTKTGAGLLTYSGGEVNGYLGTTAVNAGTLVLIKGPLNGAFAGPLVIGDGVGSDFVRLGFSHEIPDTLPITIHSSGTLDLNNLPETLGPITLNGGSIATGTGTLTLTDNVIVNASPSQARISGRLNLGGVTRTFNVANGAGVVDLTVDANISGTAGLTKAGAGFMDLTVSNSFAGLTTVSAGILSIRNDFALGSTASGTVVNSGGTLSVFNAHIGPEPLTLGGFGATSIGALIGSGTARWDGSIVLSTNTRVDVSSGGQLVLPGTISGTGDFRKFGLGTLRLTGPDHNTFTGTTYVEGGTLELAKTNLVTAVPSWLVVENGAVARYFASSQLDLVRIEDTGLVDLNGFNETIGVVHINGGGDIQTGSGTLTMGGAGIFSLNGAGATSMATVSGRLNLPAGNWSFNLTNGPFSPDLNVTAQVIGAGGFTKNGDGEMSLTAPNSYAGVTMLNRGLLNVDHSSALGSTNGGTVVAAGAILSVRFDSHVGLEPLAISGPGGFGIFGALNGSFGSNSWSGPVILAGDSTMGAVGAGDFLNLRGVITGSGDLTQIGSGTVIFSGNGSNSYAGTTVVESGTLVLSKNSGNGGIPGNLVVGDGIGGLDADVVRVAGVYQIANQADVFIDSSGVLQINIPFSEEIGSLAGTGHVALGPLAQLQVGGNHASTAFNGLISGDGGLSKFGTGALTLNGNNPYAGPTFVHGGSLVVNGLQPGSDVTVEAAGVLGGSGMVGNITSAGGTIAPGSSPGSLSSGHVNLNGASTFVVELNGTAPGSGYDQLNVAGTNHLGIAALAMAAAFPLSDAPMEGDQFVILSNDGTDPISGTFAGVPNGSILTAGGLQFRINYNGGTGNDVVLTVTNTVLDAAAISIAGGDGDGVVGPDECNLLTVTLTNSAFNAVGGVVARLASQTPGVAVVQPESPYGDIAAGATGTNSIPFQFLTQPYMVCGGNITFVLVVSTAGHGTFSMPVVVPTTCDPGSGICALCPEVTIISALGANSPQQSSRLNRDGIASDCGSVKPCPGPLGSGLRSYDAYVFQNGPEVACVTVRLAAPTADLFSAAYEGSFDPLNLCLNYLADGGLSTTAGANVELYSFNVASNQTFVVTVNEVNEAEGGTYELMVSGGSCRPVLHIGRGAGPNVVLDWSTAASGYLLETTNALPAITPAPPVWSRMTQPPVVSDGRFYVTNSLGPVQRYFRLRKPE